MVTITRTSSIKKPMIPPRLVLALFCLALVVIYLGTLSLMVGNTTVKNGTATFTKNNGASNSEERNNKLPPHVDPSTLGFDDVEIVSLKGVGAITAAFKIKIPKLDANKDYIMKVNADQDIEYNALETMAFRILSRPPTNPSIPPLIFRITKMSEYIAAGVNVSCHRMSIECCLMIRKHSHANQMLPNIT